MSLLINNDHCHFNRIIDCGRVIKCVEVFRDVITELISTYCSIKEGNLQMCTKNITVIACYFHLEAVI